MSAIALLTACPFRSLAPAAPNEPVPGDICPVARGTPRNAVGAMLSARPRPGQAARPSRPASQIGRNRGASRATTSACRGHPDTGPAKARLAGPADQAPSTGRSASPPPAPSSAGSAQTAWRIRPLGVSGRLAYPAVDRRNAARRTGHQDGIPLRQLAVSPRALLSAACRSARQSATLPASPGAITDRTLQLQPPDQPGAACAPPTRWTYLLFGTASLRLHGVILTAVRLSRDNVLGKRRLTP